MNPSPTLRKTALLAALCCAAIGAQAAEWSDTSISYRYGNRFREPFNPNNISKNIVGLTHASGYKYGTNFFNVDMLMSDNKDPASATSTNGAQEVYIVYRNTFDIGKISGKPIKWGVVNGVGITAGFDYNTKADAGYNSKKRMLVLGPTLSFDVPGFLNVGLLGLWESNAPYSTFTNVSTPRYSYRAHPALSVAWAIPISAVPGLSFEGFGLYIASKGNDEFRTATAPETNIDMQLMYDVGAAMGAPKGTFKVGLEYQYWKNKFGNNANGPAGSGAFARTPMIRAEYHF